LSNNANGEALLALVSLCIFLLLVYAAGNDSQTIATNKNVNTVIGEQVTLTNLAIIPYDWGRYDLYGEIVYTTTAFPDPPSQPQIVNYDTEVERTVGAGSAHIGPYVSPSENTAREINGPSVYFSPGDVLYFYCWIKTTKSEFGDTGFCGARTGIDFYGSLGRITAIQSDGQHGVYPNEQDSAIQAHYVPWESDWTLRVINFTIPVTLTADGGGGAYSQGQQVTPLGALPWMQIWSSTYGNTDDGEAWFADAELYINEEPAATVPIPVAHAIYSMMRRR
jgi:hypothetical protein